ncbi:MAG TPA: lysylphosphatidylglycerol synthase transmembrane domain-containing protein [Spirochaetota bacterium]|nr:lysylphosphatidylglycerol synthase transmembrane domain-containing protein [Spirochaetota bacterium]
MKKDKKKISANTIIFLMAGILILVICFSMVGIAPMIGHFKLIGHRFWIIVSIHLFSNIFLAMGWFILFTRKISWRYFPKFVAARMAGDSTTFINALGSIAGEPLKALYVRDIVPLKEGLATIFLDRTIHTISNTFIMLTGIVTAIFVLDLPPASIVLSLSLIAAIFIALFIVVKKQAEGILEYLIIKMPDFITKKYITDERMRHIRALDDEIRLILHNRSKRKQIIASFLLHYLSLLVISTLEIYLIMIYTEPASGYTAVDAMFLYIFGFILTSIMFFIPANVGTGEGSYALALVMLGFRPELGVTIGFIRRLRSFAWTLIGLALMVASGMNKKDDAAKGAGSEH